MLLARAHKYLAKHGKLNQHSQTSVSFYFFNRYELMGGELEVKPTNFISPIKFSLTNF